MSRISLAVLLVLAAPAAIADEAAAVDAGCIAAESLPAWTQLRAKYRGTADEADVERLWRRRVELCDQYLAGKLTLKQAHDAFEQDRDLLMQKWAPGDPNSETPPNMG